MEENEIFVIFTKKCFLFFFFLIILKKLIIYYLVPMDDICMHLHPQILKYFHDIIVC